MVGATALFGLVYALGRLVGVTGLPIEWRIGLGAAGLLTLAAIDVRATRKSTYCPLSWRRQTPKSLVHGHSAPFVAAVWGFDTGLAITTVRVAAITWGAILLTGLGLSVWFTGLGYGLGFALPFVVLLWTHRVGRVSRSPSPVDPGLESMLAKRRPMQAISATVLAVGSVILAGLIVVS